MNKANVLYFLHFHSASRENVLKVMCTLGADHNYETRHIPRERSPKTAHNVLAAQLPVIRPCWVCQLQLMTQVLLSADSLGRPPTLSGGPTISPLSTSSRLSTGFSWCWTCSQVAKRPVVK